VLLGTNADPIAGAVGWALFTLTSEASITTSAVTLSSDTESSITAITGAGSLNLANVTLPALLTEALSLKAITMTGTVRNHLASFKSTVWARPTLLALASRSFTNTVVGAGGSSRAKRARAINTRSLSAETFSINTKSLGRAVIGTSDTSAVDASEWLGANFRPLLGTVIGGILCITVALTIDAKTMATATILAV